MNAQIGERSSTTSIAEAASYGATRALVDAGKTTKQASAGGGIAALTAAKEAEKDKKTDGFFRFFSIAPPNSSTASKPATQTASLSISVSANGNTNDMQKAMSNIARMAGFSGTGSLFDVPTKATA